MNAITIPTPVGAGGLPATMSSRMAEYMAQTKGAPSEFAAGVTGGFAVMSIKGKVFQLKHKGVTTPVMRAGSNPPEPASSMTVVMVKANASISKIFYEAGYQEGSAEAPDCWSANGVTPDPAAQKKQAGVCATCPRNAWGSKINETTGKSGKACQDSRRVAIVPAMEVYAPGAIDVMRNEAHDGPVLLRIPPASLGELVSYDAKVRAMGFPTFGVVTKISFDWQAAYPKIVLTPVRALGPDEEGLMWQLRDDQRVETILSITEPGGIESDAAPVPTMGAASDPAAIQARALAAFQASQAAQAPVVQPAAPAAFAPPPMAAPVAPVMAPAPDPQRAAFEAFVAQQEAAKIEAELSAKAEAEAAWLAEQAAEKQRELEHEAQEAARMAAAQAQRAQTTAAIPCPPGVDPAQWAAFQAMQAGLAAQPAPAASPAPATRRRAAPAATIPVQGAAPVAPAPTVAAPVAAPAAPAPAPVQTASPSVDALLAGLNITG